MRRRGRRGSPSVGASVVGGLLVVLLVARLAGAQPANTIHFQWAFGWRVGATATTAPGPLTQEKVVRAGDQFKLFVQLHLHCFVYVLYHSADQYMDLLFPSTLQQFDTNYMLGKRYTIPPQDAWYTFTPPAGQETIYILASNIRLTALEVLLAAAVPPAAQAIRTAQILAAIRALQPVGPVASPGERPVRLGGSIRASMVLEDFAVDVQVPTFYYKALTFEQR